MHQMKAGDILGIRGPYGNGFPVEKILGKNVVFVCAGLGLAPLRSLILYCLENRSSFRSLITLYGTKNPLVPSLCQGTRGVGRRTIG